MHLAIVLRASRCLVVVQVVGGQFTRHDSVWLTSTVVWDRWCDSWFVHDAHVFGVFQVAVWVDRVVCPKARSSWCMFRLLAHGFLPASGDNATVIGCGSRGLVP